MSKSEISNLAEIEQIKKAQSARVEYLTFSGGGAKGAAYTGVISALEENNILANIRAVAGSSAGAITAALVATGMNARNFESLMSSTDLQSLLGKRKIISKDGNPLYQLLAKNTAENIIRYSSANNLAQVCSNRLDSLNYHAKETVQQSMQLQQQYSRLIERISELNSRIIEKTKSSLSEQLNEELNVLNNRKQALSQQIIEISENRQEVNNQISTLNAALSNDGQAIKSILDRVGNANGKIYFKDLELLNIIDPTTFKNLIVTATRQSDGELTIFSPATTPNVEIALAVRASASLPIVLVPVEIDGIKYVDGGYRDNTPTTYFTNKTTNDQIITEETENLQRVKDHKKLDKPRTIAFSFGNYDEQSPIFTAIYSMKEKIYDPNAIVKFLIDVLLKAAAKVGGNFKYTETVKDSLNKSRSDSHNSVIVSTPGIGTVSFKQAQENNDYYNVCGYLNTVGHINNHELSDSKDINYDTKQLFLKVYEDVTLIKQSSNTGLGISFLPASSNIWQNKIKNREEIKRGEDPKNLLPFCKSTFWQEEPDTYKIIKQFVKIAASDYKHNNLSSETLIISSLIKNLNDAKTPKNVKADFAHALGINNFDINEIQFTKTDFASIIDNNKFVPLERNDKISR